MLYVKLAIDRVKAEAKDKRERRPEVETGVQASKGAVKRGCGAGLPKEHGAAQASPSQPPVPTDSEWLGLSAEEQLSWAKNIQDPRIAVGPYSPLEKKIKSLGGIRSSEVRKLLAKKFQQENEALDKLKAMSFDFRFAKAEEYYYQQHQELKMEEAGHHRTVPTWQTEEEEKRSQSEKSESAKKWDYLVSERELNHIEKHIHRAERARGLRDHKYRLVPQQVPREVPSPKTPAPEDGDNIQKRQKTKTKRPKVAWVREQMRDHQERMIRGRELTVQRNNQREAQKITGQAPPPLKPHVEKEEVRELETVTAYPIFQPYKKALIEVTVLLKKSKKDRLQTPLPRGFLRMPPFLRSQLEKYKV